jgi:hypothetical protein
MKPLAPNLITSTPMASYEESLGRMKNHLARLADRYRVDEADVRQTLYLVWTRVGQLPSGNTIADRESYFKYLYRALVNELRDSMGQAAEHLDDTTSASVDAAGRGPESMGPFESTEESPASPSVPAVEEQIRNLFIRCCSEIAFPEAVRAHPLYGHPSYRTLLDGILGQEPVEGIAQRMGISRRRVNAQIEEMQRLFARPDPSRVDRIFRALPEDQWLPSNTIRRRPLKSLRAPCPLERSCDLVLRALRQFMALGTQPAIVYVDQYNRILQGDDICTAAHVLGLDSVATLLHVVQSDSPDMDDPDYCQVRATLGTCGQSPPRLIPAYQKLYDEGSLGPLVAAFLDEMATRAQFVILRELGTTLITMIGTSDAQALLQSSLAGTLAEHARRLHDQLCARLHALPTTRR